MTTHGCGALARFWLGSTADELVRELPMLLLLVHPKDNAVDFRKDVTEDIDGLQKQLEQETFAYMEKVKMPLTLPSPSNDVFESSDTAPGG